MNGSHYKCAVCNAGVKLYRPYGEFLRMERITCEDHIPEKAKDWYVPLIEDLDGTVWGYTSSPRSAIARWESMPATVPSLWVRAIILIAFVGIVAIIS